MTTGTGTSIGYRYRLATPSDRPLFSHLMMLYLNAQRHAGSKYLPTAKTLNFYLRLFDLYVTGEVCGLLLLGNDDDHSFVLAGNGTPAWDDVYSPQAIVWAVDGADQKTKNEILATACTRLSEAGFVAITCAVREGDKSIVEALESCCTVNGSVGIEWQQRIANVRLPVTAAQTTIAVRNDEKIDLLERTIFDNDLPLVDMPMKHTFVPGMYIREVFNPAGTVITTKIHKTAHPFAILRGDVLVFSDAGGTQELHAPYQGITSPGTRRVILALNDVVWVTFHATTAAEDAESAEERRIQMIEDRIIERRELEPGKSAHELFREHYKRQRLSHGESDGQRSLPG